ncbi:MAG: thioredoxin domain-containing protein, partial [Candidatus Micrarchaeota archaeon]|nr:thioredoxin domain-containing protein [Candidatus Micrarchaeota archaeon]
AGGQPILAIPPNATLPATPSYWAYRAALFSSQADVVANGTDALERLAVRVNQSSPAGLDLTAFNYCLNHSETLYGAYLNASLAEGGASRLYATPTFFVSGKPMVGPIPFDQLAHAVDTAR